MLSIIGATLCAQYSLKDSSATLSTLFNLFTSFFWAGADSRGVIHLCKDLLSKMCNLGFLSANLEFAAVSELRKVIRCQNIEWSPDFESMCEWVSKPILLAIAGCFSRTAQKWVSEWVSHGQVVPVTPQNTVRLCHHQGPPILTLQLPSPSPGS